MVRNILFRFPFIRTIIPRISRPLLPISRLANAEVSLTARGRQGTRLFHHFPARLTSSRSASPTEPNTPKLPPDASLSQRLKHLVKAYGWYALGVYTFLSLFDFTIAFGAVNLLGADYVSTIAAAIKEYFTAFMPSKPIEPGREEMDNASGHSSPGGHEGLYAMIILAYTIHKTLFLPIRVGLTAMFTPQLVRWLGQRGWHGGAGTRRAVAEMRERASRSRER